MTGLLNFSSQAETLTEAVQLNYGMEISAEKGKNISNTHVKRLQNVMEVKGSSLQQVNQFIYLGAIVTDNGSKKSSSEWQSLKAPSQNSKSCGMTNSSLLVPK